MDRKKAFEILELPPHADYQQARAAFRSQAKRWHPDRFAGDPDGTRRAEARMKAINAAFKCLKPLLQGMPLKEPVQNKPESDSHPEKRKQRPGPVKNKGFFTSLRKAFKEKSAYKKRPPRTQVKSFSRKQKVSSRKQADFKTVLGEVAPDLPGPDSPGGRREPRPSRPYENYRRYMAVKKRIKAAQNRSREGGIGRVEKISPVRRVNGIGE